MDFSSDVGGVGGSDAMVGGRDGGDGVVGEMRRVHVSRRRANAASILSHRRA